MMKKFTLILTLLLFAFWVNGQQKKTLQNVKVSNTKAVYLGKTKAMRDIPGAISKVKRGKKVPKTRGSANFSNRGKSNVVLPELEHQGPDPLRQTGFSRNNRTPVEPIVNVDGLSNGSPSDPSAAIGQNHYLFAINGANTTIGAEIGVYDKQGVLQNTFSGTAGLWEPLGEQGRGDPIILYDSETDQWIVTEFAQVAAQQLLVAVSETSDPMGSYSVYSFATPNFPDYPKYGIWANALTVTTNESGPGQLHQYFIDREALMSGAEDVTIQRVEIQGNTNTEAGFFVSTPVNWLAGPAPNDSRPIALRLNDSSWGEVEEDALEVFLFDIDFETPANTTIENITLVTTPYDGFPCSSLTGGFACVPQSGGGGLDALPELITNIPQYRNFGTHESIVLNFITDVTDGDNLSGIRWMELRRTEGSDWSIHQEGTFAPDDGMDRFMSSIAIDGEGNIGLGYNVTSADDFVGVRYTGRFASDPLGEMTIDEFNVIDGANTIISGARFGDYSHMTVDPTDDLTFWFTTEYAGDVANNDSFNRIVAFQLQRRDDDLAASSIVSPVTGANLGAEESVTVEVVNAGLNAATGFSLTLFLDDAEIETFNSTATIDAEGGTFQHTFATTVDLSEFREYEITVEVGFDGDENNNNNTVTAIVEHLPALNASIEVETDSEIFCSEEVPAIVTITNEGAETLTSANVELLVNGVSQEVIAWEGELALEESDEIEVTFTGLVNGDNTLTATVSAPNGETDQVAEGDEDEVTVGVDLSMEQVILTILTDNFPEETSWEFTNSDGEVVASSNGTFDAADEATEFVEVVCLETDQCYTFTLFDAASDGICCGFGLGAYSLVGPDGEVIFEGGEFGAQESTLFCVGDAMATTLDVAVELELEEFDPTCVDESTGVVILTNLGIEEVTSASIEVTVNGSLVETIDYTGALSFMAEDEVAITLTDLVEGDNEVSVNVVSPNGGTDENPDDNTDSDVIEKDFSLSEVTVRILTDRFPGETTWEITEQGGTEVVAAGGPLSGNEVEILQTVCLDRELCYTFTIFDSASDGICCGFGEGNYSLIDEETGNVLVESTGEFGASESIDFCFAITCTLEAETEVVDQVGSNLGSILITATGGQNIEYSIDGGENFQESGLFENLEAGDYDIVVSSDGGECIVEETVTIGQVVSTDNLQDEVATVAPNPTNGTFRLKLSGHEYLDGFLNVQIVDINGRMVQETKMSRYDGTFEGTVSLNGYPNGVYFIRLTNANSNRLIKIIKN